MAKKYVFINHLRNEVNKDLTEMISSGIEDKIDLIKLTNQPLIEKIEADLKKFDKRYKWPIRTTRRNDQAYYGNEPEEVEWYGKKYYEYPNCIVPSEEEAAVAKKQTRELQALKKEYTSLEKKLRNKRSLLQALSKVSKEENKEHKREQKEKRQVASLDKVKKVKEDELW